MIDAKFDFSNMPRFIEAAKRGIQSGNMAVAKKAQNSIRDNFSRVGRYASSAPGQPPNIRRGFLRRSIQVRPKPQYSAEVYSDAVYARILDRGGVIRPKNAKFLTIPVNDAARRFAEIKGTNSLKNYPFGFTKSQNGKTFLVGRFSQAAGYYTNAKGKRVRVTPKNEPVFVLKRSVQVRPRPYVQPALNRIKGPVSLGAFKVGMETYIYRAFGVRLVI